MAKKTEIDTRIYISEILFQAIEDFKDVATITFENNILYIDTGNSDEDEECFHEFMNYSI